MLTTQYRVLVNCIACSLPRSTYIEKVNSLSFVKIISKRVEEQKNSIGLFAEFIKRGDCLWKISVSGS